MASPNALVVEVVGDTRKLTKALKKASDEVGKFAQRTQSIETLTLQAGIAAVAINRLAVNLGELGGEGARFEKAINSLTSGNFVGFYKAARDNTKALSEFQKEMVATGDSSKVLADANRFAAAGFDEIAKAAREAAAGMDKASVAARKLLPISAIGAGGAFGLTDLSDPAIRKGFFKDPSIAAERARKAAEAERKRLAALREAARLAEAMRRAALARQQSQDYLALGLQTPGVPNLRKQLEQLSSRSDIGSIPNRMGAALDGARKILARKWDTISEDSRSAIQNLFETIRSELNKGSKNLETKTTGLNTGKVLAGLGLSRDEERRLRARLSGFNSAGLALAGSQSLNLSIAIDGKQVEHSVTRNQQKRARANPPTRRGR